MKKVLVSLFAAGSVTALACAATNTKFEAPADAGADGQLFAGDSAVGPEAGPACATGQYEAKQAPAAILVVLQRSGSMSQNNKWVFAAQAIVQALDADVFDTMSVGLLAAPNAQVAGPACVFNLPVACGVPAFPQVDLTPATTFKSTDKAGPRQAIKSWLTVNAPDNSAGEGNPLYSAVQSALGSLQGWSKPGKRILFVVTDGGISCTSLSNRPGFTDGNGCSDWENPNSIMQLVAKANADPQKPVETFIVGVPGSDSYDANGAAFPPYHMRAALSSIAKAGSPANVPAGCNATSPFSQSDADPKASCHFDMTQGNFTSGAIADAIGLVRGKVLGCVFELPQPDGGTPDLSLVNVDYVIGGGAVKPLYKRKDSSNACAGDGCWDYTPDNKVELIGKACDDVKSAPNAKVDITVGCQTRIN
jgi:hypothetical protein